MFPLTNQSFQANEPKQDEIDAAKRVLAVFASYGFQKTSMQDIANASGVSRQSIYKRFGSKEQCYNRVINLYLADMYSRIFNELESNLAEPFSVLLNIFTIFVGEAVEVVNEPHGTEVFNDCIKAKYSGTEDWPIRFRARLTDYLVRNRLSSPEKANGVALTLISASKGMLLEHRSYEQFNQDMTLIISSITSQA